MKFWTPAQLYAFLESIGIGNRLLGMWRILALTALRRGEVAGLRWRLSSL